MVSIATKFDNLIVRERLLIVGSLVAVIYMAWDFTLLQSTNKKMNEMKARATEAEKKSTALDAELSVFESALKSGPNSDLKKELAILKEKLENLDKNLLTLSVGLISADDLPIMLHDVLYKTDKLKLVAMETLPSKEIQLGNVVKVEKPTGLEANAKKLKNKVLAQSLRDTDAAKTEAALLANKKDDDEQFQVKNVKLYRHGVNITLSGSYQNVIGYISDLENGKWRFYWDTLEYKVHSYPNAEINLQVYTLSSNRGTFDGSQ